VRGGRPHQLNFVSETASDSKPTRYRCTRCGEGYLVRVSAPSCRIQFLEQMEQMPGVTAELQPAARRALLDVLVRRNFKWPRPVRDSMLDQFERWQVWKAQSTTVERK